ncbi:MAG: PD40 domain-containing protein [Planctomycetes bacterium]|nr:PD40 domain-containing protein [Planctomycetota bacterium]
MKHSMNLCWLVSLVLATGFVSVSSTTVRAAVRLAFLSSRQGPAQIYVLDEKGETKKVQLISDKSVFQSPQLSPDGRWIAFHSKHDSKPGLFIVRSSGGEPRHLTKEVARFLGWQYAWSPDSNRIAFLAHPGKKGADIHVVDIATAKIQRLTTGGARSPAWSPDGKSIAYMAWTGQPHTGLCVMKADGTDQRQLYRQTSARDTFPSWSSDSQQIAFQSYRREGGGIIGEVYVIDVNGGKPKMLLDKTFSVWNPAWSPDGTRIAVRTGFGGWGIDVVDVKTGKRTRCVSLNAGSTFFWYDAQRLVFEAKQDEHREIFLVKIGDEPVNLTNNSADDRLPRAVGPNRFGAQPNGE